MKIVSEISLRNFEAWYGGEDTLNRIIAYGKCNLFEAILEEEYFDGISANSLNDILRMESDWCYEVCGIPTESQLRDELSDAMEQLESLKEEFEYAVMEEAEEINANREMAGLNELDEEEMEKLRSKIWKDYADDAAELEEKISELKEELESI